MIVTANVNVMIDIVDISSIIGVMDIMQTHQEIALANAQVVLLDKIQQQLV